MPDHTKSSQPCDTHSAECPLMLPHAHPASPVTTDAAAGTPSGPIPPPSTPPSRASLMRQILALGAPTTALSLLMVVAQLVETWLAARQGTAALAGWAVMLPFGLVLQQMSTGAMGGGVVSAVAQALGAGRRDEAQALVLHALIIATGFGLVFALGVSALAPALITAVAGAEAARQASPYAFWVFGGGAVASWWGNTLASVLRGGGQHGITAKVLATSSAALPLLAWGLAEGAGLGLTGVGLAVAIQAWVAALAMVVLVRHGRAGFVPVLRARPRWPLFKRILAVGAVASALALIGNLATILVTAQLRVYGPVTVAAYGIAARLEFLIVPIAFGVGSALTALVGRSVGAGDWVTARRIAWLGGWIALAVTGVIGLAVGLWPLTFASMFTPDPQVRAIAAGALRYTGFGFGGFGIGMAMYFAALGAGRMGAPVFGGLARLAIAAGGGAILSQFWGQDGNFIAVALGIVAYGVINAMGVNGRSWRAQS